MEQPLGWYGGILPPPPPPRTFCGKFSFFQVAFLHWSSFFVVFAPVPCSASINKSSAYHFGPVRVRILLQHYCVMTVVQAPVEAAVPAAQALIQVPPVSAANDEHPQYNPATLQIQFLLVSLLRFSPARVRPFAFLSPLSSMWLLVCTVFSIVFVPSFFILSFVRLCFA